MARVIGPLAMEFALVLIEALVGMAKRDKVEPRLQR